MRAHFLHVLLLATLLAAAPAAAQEEPSEGLTSGNYQIKHSFEVGYRWSEFTGNRSIFSTFVDLEEGPRLLEHTLEMRSLDHKGLFFDDFFLTSFGYGGDPNAVTRLRAYKNRWYDFSGTFRRNRNFWDYNLLANPLNPPSSNPAVPIEQSPHRTFLVRRMSDFNLTLLPQSVVRFRLGYSRNVSEGPSFTSFHEGTEILAFQNWRTTLNSYSIGVDFRGLPKTNISYDQFFHSYKGDTTWELFSRPFQLADGTPVDLGLIFNTAANQPCRTPIADATTSPPTIDPGCNAYKAYERQGRVRSFYPTEQLSFQSSYFPNLDLAGRVNYSSSDSDVFGYEEFFQGLATRTRQVQFEINGPSEAKRISVGADLAATIRITERLRLVNTFHFANFRIPGTFELNEASLFSTSLLVPPNTFNPATCPADPSTCPQHSSSSPADVISEQFSEFLGQNTKTNQVEFLYELSRRLGTRVGYRYSNRKITQRFIEMGDLLFFPTLPNRGACSGQPLLPDGTCRALTDERHTARTQIDEHSLLLGVWTRPVDAWRVAFDLELFGADRAFTRVSPRQFQLYRVRSSVRIYDWGTLSGSVYILERRNNVLDIDHLMHDRSYSLAFTLMPSERFLFDFGYDFNDVFSQTNICFTLSGVPAPIGSPCPSGPPTPLQALSFYNHDTHYGHFQLMWQPLPRLRTRLGYNVTSTTGTTLILTPVTPSGPLRYNYHAPSAGIEIELNRHVTWKTSWGYYGYNEKQVADVFSSPRDFRGNLFTIAARVAF